jgi:hypothetical protein
MENDAKDIKIVSVIKRDECTVKRLVNLGGKWYNSDEKLATDDEVQIFLNHMKFISARNKERAIRNRKIRYGDWANRRILSNLYPECKIKIDKLFNLIKNIREKL